MLDSLIVVAVCWCLAGVFAVALVHKLRHHTRYVAALRAYQLLPDNPLVHRVIGAALTAIEVVCVILLILNTQAGLLLSAVLFAIYLVAMLINIVRGRTEIDCGCGDEPTGLSLGLVLRNIVLAGAALLVAGVSHPAIENSFVVYAAGVGMGLIAFGLYVSVDQLLANKSRHRRLWLEIG